MNDNTYNNKLLRSPSKAEQIIQYCRQKFINILPNNTIKAASSKQSFGKDNERLPEISTLNPSSMIVYKKQEVKQVMRQLSIFLQLVIQNCLLSSDTKIKAQSYRILGNFRNLLSRDLDQFQTLIYNRNKTKLTFYDIDSKQFIAAGQQGQNVSFIPRGLDMKMPPQVSLYQDPLLFYIYTRFAQDQLFINHSIHINRQQRIEILKKHVPFLDPLFIPIIYERLETKAKFSELEDRLLLILVKSKLDIGDYRNIYFPNRAEAQIKNRIKNLCGNGKEIGNPIKQIKTSQYIPLNQQQISKIISGYVKYGSRWPVIAKYYQVRSSQFLQSEFTSQEKLLKRRQKQKIQTEYTSLKQLIDSYLQQQSRKQCEKSSSKVQQVQLDSQSIQLGEEPVIELVSEESGKEPWPIKQGLEPMDQEPNDMETQLYGLEEEEVQYKIINHLTFEYQEI